MKRIGFVLLFFIALTGCDERLLNEVKKVAQDEAIKAVKQSIDSSQSGAPSQTSTPPQATAARQPANFVLHGQEIKEVIPGNVVGVSDGDTITVKPNDRQDTIRVRLASIDTPEKKQPFGQRAKQRMSELVFNRQVNIYSTGQDRYGRTIGYVMIDDWSANLQMVADGLAWHYKQYCNDSLFENNERVARSNQYGLWSDPHAVAPWEWRRR